VANKLFFLLRQSVLLLGLIIMLNADYFYFQLLFT